MIVSATERSHGACVLGVEVMHFSSSVSPVTDRRDQARAHELSEPRVRAGGVGIDELDSATLDPDDQRPTWRVHVPIGTFEFTHLGTSLSPCQPETRATQVAPM